MSPAHFFFFFARCVCPRLTALACAVSILASRPLVCLLPPAVHGPALHADVRGDGHPLGQAGLRADHVSCQAVRTRPRLDAAALVLALLARRLAAANVSPRWCGGNLCASGTTTDFTFESEFRCLRSVRRSVWACHVVLQPVTGLILILCLVGGCRRVILSYSTKPPFLFS